MEEWGWEEEVITEISFSFSVENPESATVLPVIIIKSVTDNHLTHIHTYIVRNQSVKKEEEREGEIERKRKRGRERKNND